MHAYTIIVHGKYGHTSFITQHARLRVQCVWFTLSDSPHCKNKHVILTHGCVI